MMNVKNIRFKEYVIRYKYLHMALVFALLPPLVYLIFFPQYGITANANTAFWLFGTIATGFITLLGLLFLVVSNMMRRIGEMRYILDKYIGSMSLKSKNDLDGLSKNIEAVFRNKTSALRDWFKSLWASFLGLIIYCLIMIFGTGTWVKGELDPIFLFVAIYWASLNLYLFYRMINVHLTEIAEPMVVKKA
jgi:hypothetical protein